MTSWRSVPGLEPEPVDANVSRREAMLGWMQEMAPYGIFTTDAELRIRSWNRWLANHSGFNASDIVGRALVEVFPEVASRRLDEHYRRALRGETALLSTALHRYLLPLPPTTRDFDVPHMLQTARIAPLPAGREVVGTITTLEDVTQRDCQAQILRRQQEHDRLLSSSLALLLESEKPLQVAAELFPRIAAPLKLEVYFYHLVVPAENELRLHAAGGVAPEPRRTLATLRLDAGPFGRIVQTRQAVIVPHVQSTTESEYETLRRIGLRSFVGFPLLIGDRVLGTLCFGTYESDVVGADEIGLLSTVAQYLAVASDRAFRENALREARQRLAEHAEVLETKIAERTARLHETIQQLESFTYTIAHDLRAPIRSLKGYSEVLLSDYGEGLPQEAHTILHRLHRAGERLDALTRDLLKFSKIARDEVQLEPVDLGELVDDIVLLTPALQDDIVHLQPPLGAVWAQRTLVQQCLSNLFDNALKFTAPGVKPRIVLRTELRSADPTPPAVSAPPFPSIRRAASATDRSHRGPRLRIWVEDNGIGIPASAHERIFGIFERVGGPEVEGTGIGLAIVARAMQQMGGACGVESTLGLGSRFWLELAAA